jgi:hypothetical protein
MSASPLHDGHGSSSGSPLPRPAVTVAGLSFTVDRRGGTVSQTDVCLRCDPKCDQKGAALDQKMSAA